MNVLITGTSSGIGKGCAKYFLKNGHKVYGFDRKESTIEHPDYKHYCLDIRDKEMYPELPPMQIVINNAGVQTERNHCGHRTLRSTAGDPICDHDWICKRPYRIGIPGICGK